MTVVDELANEASLLRKQAARCLSLAADASDEDLSDQLRLMAADYLELAIKVESRAMDLIGQSAAGQPDVVSSPSRL